MLQFFNLQMHFPFTILREEGHPVQKMMTIYNMGVSCLNKRNYNKNCITN